MTDARGFLGAPWWTFVLSLLAWALLALVQPSSAGGWGAPLLFAALIGTVFATVHHGDRVVGSSSLSRERSLNSLGLWPSSATTVWLIPR